MPRKKLKHCGNCRHNDSGWSPKEPCDSCEYRSKWEAKVKKVKK